MPVILITIKHFKIINNIKNLTYAAPHPKKNKYAQIKKLLSPMTMLAMLTTNQLYTLTAQKIYATAS